MNFKLRSVAVATAGALLFGFGANAMADSTFDLVQALVAKGVLTEEEALPLLKGRENDIAIADKKVKKAAKIGISDAIDNASLYGDIRVREEYRVGHDSISGPNQAKEVRERMRYKLTLGVKSTAGDFYSDLAFAMGSGGRSDNATFGGAQVNGSDNKEALYVKRAMVGWNATDWLAIEAGRVANPLYTTEMVWDKDLNMEGLVEKLNYTMNNGVELFGNFVQSQYVGDRRESNGTANDRVTNFLLAFQGGAKYKFNDNVSAKAGLTYTKFSNNKPYGVAGAFQPALNTAGGISPTLGQNVLSTNNIKTIEIPGEVTFKTSATGDIGIKLFGDYAYNMDGSDRYDAALKVAGTSLATKNALIKAGNDDTAWLLGVGLEMKQGKTPQKGDWAARLWYQEVGAYAIDPNAVDSDFFDSRVNMEGIVFKGEYNLTDNVYLNGAAGHSSRKNSGLAAVGTGNDLRVNLDNFDLIQLDLTYKF